MEGTWPGNLLGELVPDRKTNIHFLLMGRDGESRTLTVPKSGVNWGLVDAFSGTVNSDVEGAFSVCLCGYLFASCAVRNSFLFS
jgi:hypothetical protein